MDEDELKHHQERCDHPTGCLEYNHYTEELSCTYCYKKFDDIDKKMMLRIIFDIIKSMRGFLK